MADTAGGVAGSGGNRNGVLQSRKARRVSVVAFTPSQRAHAQDFKERLK